MYSGSFLKNSAKLADKLGKIKLIANPSKAIKLKYTVSTEIVLLCFTKISMLKFELQ